MHTVPVPLRAGIEEGGKGIEHIGARAGGGLGLGEAGPYGPCNARGHQPLLGGGGQGRQIFGGLLVLVVGHQKGQIGRDSPAAAGVAQRQQVALSGALVERVEIASLATKELGQFQMQWLLCRARDLHPVQNRQRIGAAVRCGGLALRQTGDNGGDFTVDRVFGKDRRDGWRGRVGATVFHEAANVIEGGEPVQRPACRG